MNVIGLIDDDNSITHKLQKVANFTPKCASLREPTSFKSICVKIGWGVSSLWLYPWYIYIRAVIKDHLTRQPFRYTTV